MPTVFEEDNEDEKYMKVNISACELDSDDLEGDMNASDDDGHFRVHAKAVKSAARVGSKKKEANKYAVEVDTNVFQVNMECLKKNVAEMATGDPTFCHKCNAVFNQASKLTTEPQMIGTAKQTWKCEFCCAENDVVMEEEEIPKSLEVNYLLEATAQVIDKKLGVDVNADISVIFCLDISGSMCVSQPIEGKHNIKGDKVADMKKDLLKFGDGSDQFFS